MPTNEYQEAVDWLFKQFPSYQNIGDKAYKPGLERVQQLAEYFGNPQEKLRFIHVAGSNGKGSTCAMLASILKESGYSTGLFTSPHLLRFSERIRVNGEEVNEDFVVQFCARVRQTDFPYEPSFFEITWLMALMYFVEKKVDIAVIEVGLGGRLDATNIILPILSIITSISLEHTQYLGNTLESIAREKGGIIKREVPVVLGSDLADLQAVFNDLANQQNAPMYLAEKLSVPDDFVLKAEYQRTNYATVLAALEVLEREWGPFEIEKGIKHLHQNTGFAGRLQLIHESPSVYLDVSHNQDGLAKTFSNFQDEIESGKLFVVMGLSSDKDRESIAKVLPKGPEYFFTTLLNNRSASEDQLRELGEMAQVEYHIFTNSQQAYFEAFGKCNKTDTLLITGSFFLASEFLA